MKFANLYFYLIIILFAALQSFPASEDTKNTVNEVIVVTASRAPITFNHLTRDVEILEAEDIKRLPVRTLQDVLEYISGTELRIRGPLGVQADVGIRGSTSDQVLVLIDGIKMNNRQTGHFNLNLPVNLDDIERIEVLKGSASKVYGGDSFAGVINIITRKPTAGRVSAKLSAGEFNFSEGTLSIDLPAAGTIQTLSLYQSVCAGYMPNTDFDISTLRWSSSLDIKPGRLDFSAGYTNKKYGANGFYSDSFPNQYEHTKTLYAGADADIFVGEILFTPKISWVSSDDIYLLDRNNPDFYKNNHSTERFSVEFNSTISHSLGLTSFGCEFVSENILSNRLGDHTQDKLGVYIEQQLKPTDELYIVAGASASHYRTSEWVICPGVDIGYRFSEKYGLFFAVNRAFRMPTFTELYYNDPVHRGDAALEPESAWTYELGASADFSTSKLKASISKRDGRNLIDWVRPDQASPWESRNMQSIETICFEIQLEYEIPFEFSNSDRPKLKAAYQYLSSDKAALNLQSKYVFDYLRHKLVAGLNLKIFDYLETTWFIRYQERIGKEGVLLADTRWAADSGLLNFYVEAKNIFNTKYEDIGSIPMPGRWIIFGVQLQSSMQD